MINSELEFLIEFPKDRNDLYIVFELFTFDNLFKLLLKDGFEHDEACDFMIANCSFSAVVFQERIHNKRYRRIRTKDVLNAEEASSKAKLIADFLEIINSEKAPGS